MRLALGILLAPAPTWAFWYWVFVPTLSNDGSRGLHIAIVVFALLLYVVALVILLPLALVLRWRRKLSFVWVLSTGVAIAFLWRPVLELFLLGTLTPSSLRESVWDAAYAFVMTASFCFIAGVPLVPKQSNDDVPSVS
jgi:hypothetical protein